MVHARYQRRRGDKMGENEAVGDVGPQPIRPVETAASIFVGSIALLIFGIQPLLYAAYAGERLVAVDHLGLLSAAEVIAIAAGSGIAIPLFRRHRPAVIAGLAMLILGAGNLFQSFHGSGDTLFMMRSLCGFGSGLLVGIAGAAIASTQRVGQWAAAYLLGQAVTQFLFVQGFTILAPTASSGDLQLTLAILSVAGLALLPLLPPHLAPPAAEEAVDAARGSRAAGFMWLVAMFFFIGGAITIWAFAGLWVESERLDPATVGSLLSLGLLGQVAGALLASVMRNGSADWLRFLASTALLLACVGAWLQWPSTAFAAFGFGFFWMSAAPILSSILSNVDPQRRALPFAPAAQLAGVAIIPTVAGIAFAETRVAGVLVAGCAAIGLSLLLAIAGRPKAAGASSPPVQ